jgi:hypothetical protein
MHREGRKPLPQVSTLPGRESALPLEYRYSTRLSGCLYGGLALFAGLVVFGTGVQAFMLAAAGLLCASVGAAGLFADPSGFLHSFGRKLIVTDGTLQEVDEQFRVHWSVRPEEIAVFRDAPGRTIFPLSRGREWRADALELVLQPA